VSPSTLNLLGLGAFVVLFVLCAVFLRVVRQHHPDVWRELGSPSMFKTQDARTSIRGMRYFRSRSHRAVIRVYDSAGNVIETHEHKGNFKEW